MVLVSGCRMFLNIKDCVFVYLFTQLTLNNAEASSENIQTLKNSIESELPKVLSSDSKHTDEKLEVSACTAIDLRLTTMYTAEDRFGNFV